MGSLVRYSGVVSGHQLVVLIVRRYGQDREE